jgi:hypothetical protein
VIWFFRDTTLISFTIPGQSKGDGDLRLGPVGDPVTRDRPDERSDRDGEIGTTCEPTALLERLVELLLKPDGEALRSEAARSLGMMSTARSRPEDGSTGGTM